MTVKIIVKRKVSKENREKVASFYLNSDQKLCSSQDI